MELSSVPGISSQVMLALCSNRITTVQHLLAWPESELAKVTGLDQHTLRSVRALVFAAKAPRLQTADVLYGKVTELEDEHAKAQPKLSGRFDVMSITSARPGDIVELLGFSCSMKTKLCVSFIASMALAQRGVVVFDCNGSFCPQYLQSVLRSCTVSPVEERAALSRVTVLPTGTLSSFSHALDCLLTDVQTLLSLQGTGLMKGSIPSNDVASGTDALQTTLSLDCLGMIVVTSIASILAPALGKRWADGQTGMSFSQQISSRLRRIARITGSVVCVMNRPARRERGEEMHPSLGRNWVHVPNIRVYVKDDCGSDSDHNEMLTRLTVCSKRKAAFYVDIAPMAESMAMVINEC